MTKTKRYKAQTGGQTMSEEKRKQMQQKSAPAAPRGLLGTPAAGASATGPVDITKALISLSPAQMKKLKKLLLPTGESVIQVPGQTKTFAPGDFASGFDPDSVATAKAMFPDLFPKPEPPPEPEPEAAPPSTPPPKPKFAKGGKVGKVMHEFKAGTLHSGSKRGPEVTSHKQAMAIALSEARKAGENVPRRHAAAGGVMGRLSAQGASRFNLPGQKPAAGPRQPDTGPLVPLQQQRVGDIQANTSGITNVANQLQNFQPGGGQDIGALRGFNPLTGAAATTQNELLTGGLQTDVAPLTEAAKIRGQQEFDTATSGINERLASMGLVSSSAQTAAEARERAKLGERIGATGLEAGVSAAEAAAGRRAGAVGTELG
ncbi:MAG: DUF6496 domain-containing protein, partial [Terriglobales bacterium]